MTHVAKVFMSGRSQAVRLPKAFRFECDEVEVTRQGEAVILRPRRAEPWANLTAALDEFDAAGPFAFDREQPPPQERPELDRLFE
ncbi:MAG: antitoxin [Geminicoccaceae bacterium]